METNNLLRHLAERNKSMQLVTGKLAKIVDKARTSVKFMLPEGGLVFDTELQGLPEEFSLPFPMIVLEYDSVIHIDDFKVMCPKELPLRHQGKDSIVQKVLVIAIQREEEIGLHRIAYVKGDTDEEDLWQVSPYQTFIPTRLHTPGSDPETGLYLEFDDEDPDFVKSEAYEVYKQHPEVFNNLFKAIYSPVTKVVLGLIEVLSCRNVTHTPLPVRKLNKGAMKRGALPFDEYRVLTIIPNKKSNKHDSVISSGDRHAPREHLRRGHIRACKSGVRVWVQSTVVNAGIGQSLNKDYKIK